MVRNKITKQMTEAQIPLELLVIDDDRIIVNTYAQMITDIGSANQIPANVTQAVGGLEGVQKYRTRLESGGGFDAVLTNLYMAQLRGTEVVELVKKSKPTTQVIVVTEDSLDAEGRRILDDIKPLEPEAVLKRMNLVGADPILNLIRGIGLVKERRATEPNYKPEPSIYLSKP